MMKSENFFASVDGALRSAAFLMMVATLVPVALIYKSIDPEHAFVIPRLFHRTLMWLLGIRVEVIGAPSTITPVLFVANHASYLDVPILGSLLSASFVAKSEVATWPLFGYLSRVQNTIFIERRPTRAIEQRTTLQDHLAKRRSLILFPEGTSSNGLTTVHFKSTLFGIVEESARDVAVTVQPISIACTKLDGMPLLHNERDQYAWYGDMTLMPHLWHVFKHGRFTVEVVFHAPVSTDGISRKALAATCQEIIARGIEQSLGTHCIPDTRLPT